MTVKFPDDVSFVDNQFITEKWSAGYFVTQGTNFFHGAVTNQLRYMY